VSITSLTAVAGNILLAEVKFETKEPVTECIANSRIVVTNVLCVERMKYSTWQRSASVFACHVSETRTDFD
jgi:hypothetical protein